jgi:hypothetical protein
VYGGFSVDAVRPRRASGTHKKEAAVAGGFAQISDDPPVI